MDTGGLVLFLAVMSGTPGPANMLLLGAATRHGVRAASGFLCGVVLGMQLVIWPAGLGLMELATGMPAAFAALKWTCTAYIVWLAWRIAGGRIDHSGDDGSASPGLARGLLVHPLNPKAWVIAAGAYTQFLPASASALGATTIVATATLVVGTLMQGLWFLGGGTLARAVAGRPQERWLMASLGAMTVASVAWAL